MTLEKLLRLNLIGIFLILNAACQSQQTASEHEINELLKQERINQQNAKAGNMHPSVQTITDPVQVEDLRKQILEKLSKENSAKEAELKNASPWEKYKRNDKTVVPALLAILQGNDLSMKKDVYFGLGKNYDDPGEYTITETILAEALLDGIDKPSEESSAVQLAGITQITGYQQRMEKRLLSGNSTDEGRIIFWLAKDAKSTAALYYLTNKIKAGGLGGKTLDDAITGLEYFAKKGNADMQKTVGETAIFIYEKQLLPRKRFEDLKNSVMTTDAAESLLECIFSYGGQKTVAIANDMLKRKIRPVGAVKALIRLEGTAHIIKIYNYLKNEDSFFTGLDIIESIDSSLVDDMMLREILTQLAKQKKVENYTIERIVNDFKKLHAEIYLSNPTQVIKNKQLADRITKTYKQSFISIENVLNDMLALGIVNSRPDKSILQKIEGESPGDQRNYIYGILDHFKLSYDFDAETDMLPCDYDVLLRGFVTKSEGILSNILVAMDTKEEGGIIDYTVKVVHKNKAFVIHPQFLDDWYDIPTVNALLEKMLEDAGCSKRFVSIDSGGQMMQYIFGYPDKVMALAKKYELL